MILQLPKLINRTITTSNYTKWMMSISLVLMLGSTSFGQTWNEVIKAVASDRAANDNFGLAISISGDYAIVGSPNEDEDAAGANNLSGAGSAYVFERDASGNWLQVQKIVASDRAMSDAFGFSVAISGDYAVVGAPFEDHDAAGSNTAASAGSAYVFERNGAGTWIEVQKIVASDRTTNDYFGIQLTISGDYLIVGASYEDDDEAGLNPFSSAGSAYVFERDGGGAWNQAQKLVASDRAANDAFGFSLSISGDYAVIGAYTSDLDEAGINLLSNAGAAYIFERDGAGTWNQVQKIVASDRAALDKFANAVSISGDYLIIGAPEEDEDELGANTISKTGSGYIFERDGAGTWNQVQKIVSSDRALSDEFGYAVGISSNYAVIGARSEDEDALGLNTVSSAGSAYMFERDGAGTWSQAQKIVTCDRGTATDRLGQAAAISGSYVLLAAPLEDEDVAGANNLTASGSVYFYDRATNPDVPVITSTPAAICDASSGTLTWTGSLNSATVWAVYTTSCGTGLLGTTATNSFVISPTVATTYYIRGENAASCGNQFEGSCGSLLVTLLAPLTGNDNTTICAEGSVTINGTVYDAATPNGTEVFTGIGPSGCDSTVTVALNVLPAITGNDNTTICAEGSVMINGTVYDAATSTGTEVFSNIGPNNCDSTVTVALNVLPAITGNNNTTICAEDSVTINGTVYNAATPNGTEVFTNIGPNNCDSTVTVALNVLPAIVGSVTTTICNEDSVTVNGTVYNAANPTGTEVFPNIGPNNCDSTVTVALNVLPALVGTVTSTICNYDSVVVNGTVYNLGNPTGTEVFTNISANNCDSTVTINLNVLAVLTGNDNTTICAEGSVTINGTVYDAATPIGTEVFTGIGVAGCDSTVTVALNVLPALTGTNNTTICAEDSVTINGTVYNAANPTGTEVFTGIGANACDSTVTVALNVLPVLTGSETSTICNNDSIVVKGTTYNAANPTGTEVFTGIGANSCDSTVTINLTVISAIDITTTTSGVTITSNEVGATYQWIDCNNGNAAIVGEVGVSYSATVNGDYAVVITAGSCTDTSACININSVGITQTALADHMTIYPNPSNGQFTIDMGASYSSVTVMVMDMSGKMIQNNTYNSEQLINIKLDTPAGIYVVRVTTDAGVITKRLFVE